MPHQLTENVKFLHKVAIVREQAGEKQVLVLQRSADAFSRPNCWDLPGGNSEWPESDQASAADLHQLDVAREIQEESHLSAAPELFNLDRLNYFSSYFDQSKQMYTIICGWQINLADTDQAEIIISPEHQNLAWVSASDLANYDFDAIKGQFVLAIVKKALA